MFSLIRFVYISSFVSYGANILLNLLSNSQINASQNEQFNFININKLNEKGKINVGSWVTLVWSTSLVPAFSFKFGVVLFFFFFFQTITVWSCSTKHLCKIWWDQDSCIIVSSPINDVQARLSLLSLSLKILSNNLLTVPTNWIEKNSHDHE